MNCKLQFTSPKSLNILVKKEYTQYKILKSLRMLFSFINLVWIFTIQHPTMVSHHAFVPISLVESFHSLNILLEASPCSSLTAPRFSGKKSRWECKKTCDTPFLYDHRGDSKLNPYMHEICYSPESLRISIWRTAKLSIPADWGPFKFPYLLKPPWFVGQ